MKMILNIAAAAMVLSTGCVKADQYADCVQQATAAHALVHARDAGTPKENIANYIDTKEPLAFRPTFHRILNTAYSNPGLDKTAAYNGELSYCLAHAPKQKVVGK